MKAFAVCLLSLLGRASLCAAPPPTGLDLDLRSEVRTIKAGEPFTVGLHIHHHEGFHTYWQNPGIVGVATALTWTLPEGFHAGPIEWPSPELVDMSGHPAHGYHRDVLLLVEITPPFVIADKTPVLRADAHWMACAKTCHPGNASLSLPLSVGTEAEPDPAFLAAFAQARREMPPPLAGWTVTLRSTPGAARIQLRLAPGRGTSSPRGELYFFSSDGQVSSDRAQSLTTREDGSLLLTLARNQYGPAGAKSLPGLLRFSSPDGDSPLLEGTIDPTYPKVTR